MALAVYCAMDGSHALIVVLLIVIILLVWRHHKMTVKACTGSPAVSTATTGTAAATAAAASTTAAPESFNPAVWYSGNSTYASTLGRTQGMANAGAVDHYVANPGVGTNWDNYMNRTVLPG